MTPQNPARAIYYIVAAAGFFSFTHTMVRHIAGDVHPFEIVFFRNFFSLIFLLPLISRNNFAGLRTKHLKLHFVRGLINSASILLFFLSLSMLTVAEVTALNFTSPLFVTILAMLFLGETVGWRRWGALLVGFIGMLIIVRPGLIEVSAGAYTILGASLLWGGVMIVVKMLSRTESSITISAYMAIFLIPVTLVAAVPFWTWPSWEQLAWMAAIGATATIAQTCMAESFRFADASAVMPFDFTRLLWAALFGFIAFGEFPDRWVWVGGGVIFLSTIYISRRESMLRKAASGLSDG